MTKESWYFSHDFHARDDLNIQYILMQNGLAGVGLYWCLIEVLHENNGVVMRSQCERIAFALRSSPEAIIELVEKSGCFEFDDEKFWSKRVIRNLEERQKRRESSKNAAKKRWSNQGSMRPQCDRNAEAMHKKGKERKEKEKKEEEELKKEKEKVKKEKKEKFFAGSVFDFSNFNESECDAIKKWFDYRKELKKPYKTQKSYTELRNKLLDLSNKKTLEKSVLNSISNQWQGLFEIKSEVKNGKLGNAGDRVRYEREVLGIGDDD